LPPEAKPVQSSRLIQRRGPPSKAVSLAMGSSGVGKWPKQMRGKQDKSKKKSPLVQQIHIA
jgi:hypothetical protein